MNANESAPEQPTTPPAGGDQPTQRIPEQPTGHTIPQPAGPAAQPAGQAPAQPAGHAPWQPAGHAPWQPAAAAPAAPAPGTPAPAAPAPAAKPGAGRGGRIALITAGAVAAALAIGGGGVAIGAAVAGANQQPQVGQGPDGPGTGDQHTGGDRSDSDGTDRNGNADSNSGSDAGPDPGSNPGSNTGSTVPGADAASLRSAAQAAIDATGAVGVTSIDLERNGYDIDVRLADGTDRDVFVTADGAVSESRDDDRSAEPVLDLDVLADVIDAALTASETKTGTAGTIDSVSTSDDPGIAYEVGILLTGGRDVDVDLDARFAVVWVDVDD